MLTKVSCKYFISSGIIQTFMEFDGILEVNETQLQIGHLCNDLRESYHKYGVGKHLIFYRLKGEDRIEIVRILHSRMDIGQHL